MKHALMAALVFSMALPTALLAQAKTDFSGTWTFDEAKSDPAPARAGGGGGGGGGRGGGRMGGAPATAMTIKQTPAELSMDRTTAQGAQTVVYKLDGSESTRTPSAWARRRRKRCGMAPRLVVTTTQTVQGRGGEITINSKEIYSVAGNTLTIETTRTTPAGEQTRKLIYTKG